MGIIARAALKVALKAASKNKTVVKYADTFNTKLNELTKTMTNEDALADEQFKFHLIVDYAQDRSIEYPYDVFSENNKIYKVKRPSSNWRHEIHLYDTNNNLIGKIKEHKPFFKEVYEQKERTCDIELNGQFIGQVRTCDLCVENSLIFDYNDFEVIKNIFNTKIEVYDKQTLVCRINNQFGTSTSRGKYIISYNDEKFEKIFLLFVIAMDKISSSDY